MYGDSAGPSARWIFAYERVERVAESAARRYRLSPGLEARLSGLLIEHVHGLVETFEDRERGPPFEACVNQLLNRRVLDFLKSVRRAGLLSRADDPEAVTRVADGRVERPLDAILRRERVAAVRECLSRLSDEGRARLLRVDGLREAVTAVAATLGIRRDTLSAQLQGLRANVRRCMRAKGFFASAPTHSGPASESSAQ